MSRVAAYIHERNGFSFVATPMERSSGYADYEVMFADGLDNARFDEPLTVDLHLAADLEIRSVD